jgi:hypothetical protein
MSCRVKLPLAASGFFSSFLFFVFFFGWWFGLIGRLEDKGGMLMLSMEPVFLVVHQVAARWLVMAGTTQVHDPTYLCGQPVTHVLLLSLSAVKSPVLEGPGLPGLQTNAAL